MTQLVVGAVQIACIDNVKANLDKIETHVREAARRGAKLVVLQELFEGPYFCIDIDVLTTSGPSLLMAIPQWQGLAVWQKNWVWCCLYHSLKRIADVDLIRSQ